MVVSGRVISSEYSESGEERIYSVNEKGSLILEENLLFGYKVPVNIRTITETEVVRVMKELKEQGLVEKKKGYYYLNNVEQMRDGLDEKWA